MTSSIQKRDSCLLGGFEDEGLQGFRQTLGELKNFQPETKELKASVADLRMDEKVREIHQIADMSLNLVSQRGGCDE